MYWKISKYKNISAKGYAPNWSEEIFAISRVKKTVPWIYVVNDLNGEEIVGTFYERNCKRQIKRNLEQKKQLKEKERRYMPNRKDMMIH